MQKIGILFIVILLGSDGVVRPSIPAFRADDSGSNPGRSTFIPALFIDISNFSILVNTDCDFY